MEQVGGQECRSAIRQVTPQVFAEEVLAPQVLAEEVPVEALARLGASWRAMVDPVTRLYGFGSDDTPVEVAGPTERAAAVVVDRPAVGVALVAWETCRSRLGPGSPS